MHTATKERGRMRLKYNVGYQLRDANGNVKPIFRANKFGMAILKALREGYNPYNADGTPKAGLRAKLALNGLQIPGLTGNFVNKLVISNTVTNAGKAAVAALINGATATNVFDYIAIGTGTTGAAVGDTALETESSGNGADRAQGTASRVTTDVTNDTARVVNTFNFTGSFAITESGLLNAASTGTLLCRQVFTAINVVSGDSLQVTWDVDVD